MNKLNTSLGVKKGNIDKFFQLLENQMMGGGDKYRLSEKKEFTDAICECFPGDSGVDWVLGTIMKYLGRYKNFGKERDLLKIVGYVYILWLKAGFHLKEEHDEDKNYG